ncbi:MAG TPA: ferric reductase-like transmembrane domain-containing protein [Rubrobacteraceae bacterium]|nr:ferric reductase-like transmembrane domain-containing protein [Rubrobacteraceae bacterium]
MIVTFLALFALVLVASVALIALLWRAKPVPAVWVAGASGTLGLILAAASLTTNIADLGTVIGVVLLAGILGAGWNPQRKSIYLVVGYVGLLAGILARFVAFTSALEISTVAASNTIPWGLTRSAGFVAFLCATGSVIFGARRPSRLPLRGLPARIYALHRALGIAALVALVVHLLALRLDTFIGFSWSELLVFPWAGPYRPRWVTLGWLAMILLILTAASGGLRRLLPGWRTVHLLAYLTFALSLFHGLFAGSDSGSYLILAVYLVSLLAVVAALLVRFYPGLLSAGRRAPGSRVE